MFAPKFQITPELTKVLMDIEANRQSVSSLSINVSALTSLRESARLYATHYSTQIEGNLLTQGQVENVIHGGTFPNREREEREVKNYYQALEFLDTLIKKQAIHIAERDIQTLHGLVMNGKKKATPYRDGQNVIRDSSNRAIVYMPPEAKDVPFLMSQLMVWINENSSERELPVPLIAAIAHYQFATIHPYYDGNGRTARLLTNLVLHKLGYGLKGIYSLEEYYARDLQAYYQALTVSESHNYYFRRVEADITEWCMYFCAGMADSFAKVRITATRASEGMKIDHSSLLRELDQRQKIVLSLFEKRKYVTTREVADLLGVHIRTALNMCNRWCNEGFMVKIGEAPKSRKYELANKWLELVL